MKRTFKQSFEQFVSNIYPSILILYNDFMNRSNPTVGDKYWYFDPYTTKLGKRQKELVEFVKIEFDPTFEQGTAFYYIFNNCETNKEVKVYSINHINENEIIPTDLRIHIYGFWRNCVPVTN